MSITTLHPVECELPPADPDALVDAERVTVATIRAATLLDGMELTV